MTDTHIAYFDCFSGVSGDMIVAAMIDLGLPLPELDEALKDVGLPDVRCHVTSVMRRGMRGTHVQFLSDRPHHLHTFRDMRATIDSSSLPPGVKELTGTVLARLAAVEARVHGLPVEQVHFHEIGDIDTLADTVACAVGVRHFGWDEVISSPLPLGRGWVVSEHGPLPLPAPATIELLHGVPTVPLDTEEETVTPTGAAIITSFATKFGGYPPMNVGAVGYGAGSRDSAARPNLLRIVTGVQQPVAADRVWVVETDIDDMIPELVAHLPHCLMTEGALDVTVIPIHMKKGRPGFTVRLLASEEHKEHLARRLLEESTTLGVRVFPVERRTLTRETREVATRYGPIIIKVGLDSDGTIITLTPEYESCLKAATQERVPLKEVYQEAIARGRQEP